MPIIVQYPVPEVGWHVPNLNFKYLVSMGEFPSVISTDAGQFAKRNSFITDVLNSLVDRNGIVGVRPASLLCDTYIAGRCVAQFESIPLYFDEDHLSVAGASLVVKEIMRYVPHQAFASHP